MNYFEHHRLHGRVRTVSRETWHHAETDRWRDVHVYLILDTGRAAIEQTVTGCTAETISYKELRTKKGVIREARKITGYLSFLGWRRRDATHEHH